MEEKGKERIGRKKGRKEKREEGIYWLEQEIWFCV